MGDCVLEMCGILIGQCCGGIACLLGRIDYDDDVFSYLSELLCRLVVMIALICG